MLTKHEYDLIWKIRHGAIPTGRFLNGCIYHNCNYSGELLMLDAHATGFMRMQKFQLYIVESTKTGVV